MSKLFRLQVTKLTLSSPNLYPFRYKNTHKTRSYTDTETEIRLTVVIKQLLEDIQSGSIYIL